MALYWGARGPRAASRGQPVPSFGAQTSHPGHSCGPSQRSRWSDDPFVEPSILPDAQTLWENVQLATSWAGHRDVIKMMDSPCTYLQLYSTAWSIPILYV